MNARAMLALALCAAAAAACARRPARTIRVCADPNNLPYSNREEQGFENRIASLLAADRHATLEYTWWAQRRGFVRNTLKANACDVVIGVPSRFEPALTTKPYYRSAYVFVTKRDRGLHLQSFDDPALRRLRIGVQMIGDDFSNTPPAHALSNRGLVPNVVGYTVYGDYAAPHPLSGIVDAVDRGEVDAAVVWGPQAGYFARFARAPLDLTPVSPRMDTPSLPFAFDISMGVRRGDTELRDELDEFLVRRRGDIDSILRAFGVPRTDAATEGTGS